MQFFDELGRLIEQRWRDKNYGEEAFPEVAESALAEMDAVGRVDPWEVTRYLHEGTELPGQQRSEFSDLPVGVYSGPRFRVEVYFWLDGTTAIHQHGFSGAFQVLEGSSIHSIYDFRQEQAVSTHLATGGVLLKEVQVLRKGEIRRILPGGQFIHSLFHLDRPSVTITVRTNQTLSALPQFAYLKPHLAVDPFLKDYLTQKKVQSARMLLQLKHPSVYAQLGDLISSSDFHTTFLILATTFEYLIDSARSAAPDSNNGNGQPADSADEWDCFHGLLKHAHVRHGQLVNLIPPVLGEAQRERALIGMRNSVTGSEHRLFLALLLNVPHRATILDLVKQCFPDRSPVDTVCDWLVELSATKSLKSPGANVLGMDDFNETHLFVFRHLLEGLPAEQLGSVFESAGGNIERGAGLEEAYQSFQRSTLFKSLLFMSPSMVGDEARLRSGAAA